MSGTLYSTKVTVTGGRHGSIRSDDGLLGLKLALPRTLGGKGDATNPEQLFAGGYAPALRMRCSARAAGLVTDSPMATSESEPRSASAATTRVGSCCPPRSP
jgi:organic hydroperoxide reductase OsmC/OhrA